MQHKHIIGLTLAISALSSLMPLANVQAKTTSDFPGESLVYFDYATGKDNVFATDAQLTTSYQSANPLSSADWKSVDSWANFGKEYTATDTTSSLDYVITASPVRGKAVSFKGQQYFAVNVDERTSLSIESYKVEIWQVAQLGGTPKRVASLSNPNNSAEQTFAMQANPGSFFSLKNSLYLIDNSGDVLTSQDGATWKLSSTRLKNQMFWDIATSDDTIYVGSDAGILTSTNGIQWDTLNTPFCDPTKFCRIQNVAVSPDNSVILADYVRAVDGPSQLYRKTSGAWEKLQKSKYGFDDLAINGDRMAAAKREIHYADITNRVAILTGSTTGTLKIQQRHDTINPLTTIIGVDDQFLSIISTADDTISMLRNR